MQRAPYNPPKIIDIQTANPELCLTQEEALAEVVRHISIPSESESYYEKFFLDKGIEKRYFATDNVSDVFDPNYDHAVERFRYFGTKLGSQAIQKILKQNQLNPENIDALIVTTCTGYLCPGFSSYLAEEIGFKENIFTLDMVGHGCGAALPALQAARNFLCAAPSGSNVLVLCIEICSAASFWDHQIDLILSNAIFSDGAAACLLTNRPQIAGFTSKQYGSLLWPKYRDDLRFKTRDSRLCNVLGAKVPVVVSKAAQKLWNTYAQNQPTQPSIFGFHAGGRSILDHLQKTLGLSDAQMQPSRSILQNYGNMSSPTVLYVLKQIKEQQPETQQQIALFSFGAGLTAFFTEITWENAHDSVR